MKCENCQNKRPVTTGPMVGFVRCAKGSVADFWSPVIERQCELFLLEVV